MKSKCTWTVISSCIRLKRTVTLFKGKEDRDKNIELLLIYVNNKMN